MEIEPIKEVALISFAILAMQQFGGNYLPG
jgi:hypothetical protein